MYLSSLSWLRGRLLPQRNRTQAPGDLPPAMGESLHGTLLPPGWRESLVLRGEGFLGPCEAGSQRATQPAPASPSTDPGVPSFGVMGMPGL